MYLSDFYHSNTCCKYVLERQYAKFVVAELLLEKNKFVKEFVQILQGLCTVICWNWYRVLNSNSVLEIYCKCIDLCNYKMKYVHVVKNRQCSTHLIMSQSFKILSFKEFKRKDGGKTQKTLWFLKFTLKSKKYYSLLQTKKFRLFY